MCSVLGDTTAPQDEKIDTIIEEVWDIYSFWKWRFSISSLSGIDKDYSQISAHFVYFMPYHTYANLFSVYHFIT